MPPTNSSRHRAPDAELLAEVAIELRPRLLRAYRGRLSREDLEDAYSQALIELLARAQRTAFTSADHIRNALQQKFDSRICDQRRALAGRSPARNAEATAIRLDQTTAPELMGGPDPAELVLQQEELDRVIASIGDLTDDQRLALASELSGEPPRALCRRTGWSSAKQRKVAQRARKRLRADVGFER